MPKNTAASDEYFCCHRAKSIDLTLQYGSTLPAIVRLFDFGWKPSRFNRWACSRLPDPETGAGRRNRTHAGSLRCNCGERPHVGSTSSSAVFERPFPQSATGRIGSFVTLRRLLSRCGAQGRRGAKRSMRCRAWPEPPHSASLDSSSRPEPFKFAVVQQRNR